MASRRIFNTKKPNYIFPANPEIITDFDLDFEEVDVYNCFNEALQLEPKKSMPTTRSKKCMRNKDISNVTSSSLPVNVPDWSKILQQEYSNKNRGGNDDDECCKDERLPPHEYLARLRGASFSVHEGIGRTLKGRDLRSVRTAIWQQTGFED